MGGSGLGTPRDCACPGGPPASPGGVRPVSGNVETKSGMAHPAADVQGRFLLFLTPFCQEKEGKKGPRGWTSCGMRALHPSWFCPRARNAPAFAFKTGLGDTEMNGETQAGPVNVPFCFTWSKLKTNERTSEKPSKRTNSVSSRERDRGGREEAFHSGASRDTFSSFLRKGPSVFVLQCPTRPVAGAVPSFFTSLHP